MQTVANVLPMTTLGCQKAFVGFLAAFAPIHLGNVSQRGSFPAAFVVHGQACLEGKAVPVSVLVLVAC